jgi:uncharacterized circularly permuted ATP-grasp superfamily protein
VTFEKGALVGDGVKIDILYRRVLMNDVIAQREHCAALVEAYAAKSVCMANTFRCKLAHKKAFFAVLTDERNAHLFSDDDLSAIKAHIPWTRVVADEATSMNGTRQSLLAVVVRNRETLVLKPNDEYGGTGVTLGWETSARDWDAALNAALGDPKGSWVVQERIPVRREVFPMFDGLGEVTMHDMLVDFAPYLFRGRMTGYLTRLSATGRANVTSGGGQVPAFIVSPA